MMTKKIVFMFSGQGSHYYHMGKELFMHDRIFREWMQKLDDIAYEMIGKSVLEQLYNENNRISDSFARTLYTHPAIFMVEVALAQVMLQKGIEPDVVLGSSMGEFASAAVSGVMPGDEALKLVCKQAETFETQCQKGGMLTILHDPALYHENPGLFENSELAAVNYSAHFVVSGKVERLQDISAFLKRKNIDFQLLPVSFAFHSPLIEAAETPYLDYLKDKRFQSPAIPYASCLYGKIIREIPPGYFWQIVRKPMVLPEALENLDPGQDYLFLDLGPSGTLANFVKNNLANSENCFMFMTPFGGELKKIEKFKEFFGTRPNQTNYRIKKEEKKMKVHLFPGQGSQQKGMGNELFDQFKDLTEKADKVLGYSIKELCLEDPREQLTQTLEGQVDPEDDPIDALADYYLEKAICARMIDSEKRFNHIWNLVENYDIQAVIYFTLKFCDNNLFDFPYQKKKLDERGIPVFLIEAERSIENIEQLKTRIIAFLESRIGY